MRVRNYRIRLNWAAVAGVVATIAFLGVGYGVGRLSYMMDPAVTTPGSNLILNQLSYVVVGSLIIMAVVFAMGMLSWTVYIVGKLLLQIEEVEET